MRERDKKEIFNERKDLRTIEKGKLRIKNGNL
jgi:hypothetical protein